MLPDMMAQLEVSERSCQNDQPQMHKSQREEFTLHQEELDSPSEIQDVLGSYLQENTQDIHTQIETDSNQNKGPESSQQEASGGQYRSRSERATDGSQVRQRAQVTTTALLEQAAKDSL